VVGTPAHNGQYENSKQASAARRGAVVQKKAGSEAGTRDPTHFGELVVAAVVLALAAVVVVIIAWATYRESTQPNRKQPHSVHAHLLWKVLVLRNKTFHTGNNITCAMNCIPYPY